MNEYGKRVAQKMENFMGDPDSIDFEINDIQNAIEGIEVRGALAAGVKKAFDKSKKAEIDSAEAREITQDLLNESFDSSALNQNFEQRLNDEIANLQPEWTGFKNDVTLKLDDIGVNVRSYVESFTDTTEAIRSAENDAFLLKKPLIFPSGYEFVTQETIHIRENIDVIMKSPIVYAADDNNPALIIGNKGIVNYAEELVLNVKRRNVSDWSDENSIGVQLINCNNTRITIVQARGFTKGAEALGSGQGFTYCQVFLGDLINNKIGLDVANESYNGKIGWSNETSYYGGRFSCLSNVGVGKDRIGVRLISKDDTNLFNNNNTFYAPNFELNQNMAGEGVALPVLIEHGGNNRFYDYRDEGNGPYTAKITGRSRYNTFVVGFSELTKDPRVLDETIYPSTVVEHTRDFPITKNLSRVIFSSGKMADTANIYNKDEGSAFIPYVSIANAANTDVYRSRSSVRLGNDHIEVDDTSAIGVFVDTSQVKTFFINKDTLPNYHGMTYIICYNSNGNVMSEGDVPLVRTRTSSEPLTFDTGGSFGGGYRNVTTEDGVGLFTVHEDVKKIRILLGRRRVGEPLRIKSFSITAIGKGETSVFNGLEKELIPGFPYAVNPPETGPRGVVIYNVNAAAGGYSMWQYVGASGTLRKAGQIE